MKIRKQSSSIFRKTSKAINRMALHIYRSPQEKRVAQWFADNGETTLRYFYDELNQGSLVFDLGGYEGQWASNIYSMYRCKIHVFEPVEDFAKGIRFRFRNNSDIVVHQFGLADRTCTTPIALDENSSSAFKRGKKSIDAHFVEASSFFANHNIEFIDLLKINIEGGEYDLLDYLLETSWTNRVGNIQVQFHEFIPNAENRMARIQNRLRDTHDLTYQHTFVWENWRLRR